MKICRNARYYYFPSRDCVSTTLNYDRVIVLDQGEIKEYDCPAVLLNKPGGLFKKLEQMAKYFMFVVANMTDMFFMYFLLNFYSAMGTYYFIDAMN